MTPDREAALRLARGWEAKPLPTEKITPEGIGIVARALLALAADLEAAERWAKAERAGRKIERTRADNAEEMLRRSEAQTTAAERERDEWKQGAFKFDEERRAAERMIAAIVATVAPDGLRVTPRVLREDYVLTRMDGPDGSVVFVASNPARGYELHVRTGAAPMLAVDDDDYPARVSERDQDGAKNAPEGKAAHSGAAESVGSQTASIPTVAAPVSRSETPASSEPDA